MAEPVVQLEEVGRTIAGRYVIEELLGRGGSAAVYRVTDTRTNARLALKRGFAAGPRKTRRRQELLEREFNTLTQLAHPCIIEVYDYGVDEQSCAYYTMELLDGADLHNCGMLPWQTVCTLLRDVASSLAILHSRGMVHRDVSARNVRRTADGRAKLLDFGAMTSMGVAHDVVGTPPFLAPEVMQMQALDARADLFSLGALAYYLLAGRHAYPARRLHDLRDMWRSAPTPVSRIAPETPPALSALVMQLLSLDRSTRAHSAPEVMTRLCTIAGLPLTEQAQVSRAYLTTPSLVGREAQLVSVRKSMLALARGDGATLILQGVSGSGRSRMLDACSLEAKLVGAQVIRAGATSERSDWDVARVLGAQLVQLMPEQVRDASRMSRDVIGQVIDGLRADRIGSWSSASADRNLLIRELRDFILALARHQRLVIVVDDADHIDEPSAALIAALAHKTERHPVLLALSVDREHKHNQSASLRLMHTVAVTIELAQLDADQTEALVRSVFGAVPNLPRIAAQIHALSHGNPRAVMELAQHLVDREFARYQAGTWSLPDKLSEQDLPDSLAASLNARLARLSTDAIEVCEALCLADADGSVLPFDAFSKLSTHHDPKRIIQAFDELFTARVLIADSDHYRFSQRGFVSVLQETMPRARFVAIHSRLADALAERGGDLVPRAQHLLSAKRDAEAIQLLCSIDLTVQPPPVALLEAAIERAQQHNSPAGTVHELRRALLVKATPSMAFDSYMRHAPLVFAQLSKDSGYDDFVALSHVAGPERLTQALVRANERFLATPEHERVYPVQEAISQFALFALAARAMGLLMLDAAFIASLPSLEPFTALSPALQVVALAGEGTVEWVRGRFEPALAVYEQVLERLSQPDRANLSEADHMRFRLSVVYGLGVLQASRGVASAEMHAEVLEREREYRVNAWRVRKLWHLSRGNIEEANQCQRRADLLQAQDGMEQAYAGTSVLSELSACVLAGDLLGIKNALDVVGGLAEQLPGWRPFVAYGEAGCQQLQGDHGAALATVLGGLANAPAGNHPAFGFLAGVHVSVLCELGRIDEAIEHGLAYVETSERNEISTTGQVVYVATADALSQAGQGDRAVRLLDAVIAVAEARGQTGVSIGSMYETRARIATRANDSVGFERFAARCAAEYRKGTSPFLAAKFARLLDETRQVGAWQAATTLREAVPAPNTEYLTIHSRMLECVDEDDRARCALTMLLQDLESFSGYLFGVNGTGLSLLAALPEEAVLASAEVERWLRVYVVSELADDDDRTGELGPDDAPQGGSATHFAAPDGRLFQPMLLSATLDGQQVLAAVLVFHTQLTALRHANRQLVEQIAMQLLEHSDVTGVRLTPAAYTETRRS